MLKQKVVPRHEQKYFKMTFFVPILMDGMKVHLAPKNKDPTLP